MTQFAKFRVTFEQAYREGDNEQLYETLLRRLERKTGVEINTLMVMQPVPNDYIELVVFTDFTPDKPRGFMLARLFKRAYDALRGHPVPPL